MRTGSASTSTLHCARRGDEAEQYARAVGGRAQDGAGVAAHVVALSRIAQNDVVLVLGASGAGKSTLLRSLQAAELSLVNPFTRPRRRLQ